MSQSACSVTHHEIAGWKAITISNGLIAVTVLPEKGADIFSFVYVASGLDVLGKTPWGLSGPSAPPRAGSGDDRFLRNYEGAWQELFPNTFRPCIYRGLDIPLHGEVATLPWALEIEERGPSSVRVKLSVACEILPLRLTRTMSLQPSSHTLLIDEVVTNVGREPVDFVWGHHPVLGAPFLEEGCSIRAPDCTVHTPDPAYELATASLQPGQCAAWPFAKRLDGGDEDLRCVRGASAGTHDHAYLSGFEQGLLEVENARLGLVFALQWDPAVFRSIINWRPFGGSNLAPLDGVYLMGVELWASNSNLAESVAQGTALGLAPGGVMSTSLKASLRPTRSRLEG